LSMQKYRYAIELYIGDGTCLGQSAVTVDWEPAIEHVWLGGLRRGQLQLSDGTDASVIQPVWHREAGRPYVEGFRVTILSEGADGVSGDFSTGYFKRAAAAAKAKLVEEGRVHEQDAVRYLALAFYNEAHALKRAQAGPAPHFKASEVPPDITLVESRLSDFVGVEASLREPGQQREPGDDIPIVVPRRVLREARELAARAGDNETGGILIGHLRRDSSIPEVFVEVTAQVPAAHAPAQSNRLTFTPETWTAAQAAIDLRHSDETFVGWWHLHRLEAICRDCPPEKRTACPLAHGFLSADDRLLHRAVFAKAYSCALLLTDVGDGSDVTYSAFGWRHGRIERRAFHVLEDAGGGGTVAPDTTATPHGKESPCEET
jgi:hypothetical protein